MARTSEQTLPNVMLEKGLFDDLKILNLLEMYGCVGFTVYVSLLFKIADDKGYYTQMSSSLIAAIQKDIGNKWVSRDKIIGVINGALECELLDSSLFKQGVLTSVGIQRRYLDTKKKSRARGFSIEKYWLLEESQADNPIEYNNEENEHNNADYCNNNADKCNNNSAIKRSITVSKTVVAGLTETEYRELCEKLGKEDCDYYIERVKAFRQRQPQAAFSVKSVILKWYREDAAKGNNPRIGVDNSAEALNAAFAKLNEDL